MEQLEPRLLLDGAVNVTVELSKSTLVVGETATLTVYGQLTAAAAADPATYNGIAAWDVDLRVGTPATLSLLTATVDRSGWWNEPVFSSPGTFVAPDTLDAIYDVDAALGDGNLGRYAPIKLFSIDFQATAAGTSTLVIEPDFTTGANFVLWGNIAEAGGNYELASTVVTVLSASGVQGREVFYNNSPADGNDPAANAADDNAIDAGKQPLLPGETSTAANFTGYGRGINGVMVDINNLPGTPTAADFVFKVGTTSDPDAWQAAPAPQSVTVRPGAGANGSDRVTIIWADNAVQNTWLSIEVLPTDNTGLAESDVFFWGNLRGDYDASGIVGQSDLDLVLLNWGSPSVPPSWVNGQPAGSVGQAELDGVLLSWGSQLPPLTVEVQSSPQELFFDGGFEAQGAVAGSPLPLGGGGDNKSWDSAVMAAAGVSEYGWFVNMLPAVGQGTLGLVDYGLPGSPDYKLENATSTTINMACLVGENLTGVLTEGSTLTYSLTLNGAVGADITLYMLPRYQADVDDGTVTYNGGSLGNQTIAAGSYVNVVLTYEYVLPAVAPSGYDGLPACTAPFEAMMVRINMGGSAANSYTLDNFSLTVTAGPALAEPVAAEAVVEESASETAEAPPLALAQVEAQAPTEVQAESAEDPAVDIISMPFDYSRGLKGSKWAVSAADRRGEARERAALSVRNAWRRGLRSGGLERTALDLLTGPALKVLPA